MSEKIGNSESKMPDNFDGAIGYLRELIDQEILDIESDPPSSESSVGERISHARRAKHITADLEFIDELQASKELAKNIPPTSRN